MVLASSLPTKPRSRLRHHPHIHTNIRMTRIQRPRIDPGYALHNATYHAHARAIDALKETYPFLLPKKDYTMAKYHVYKIGTDMGECVTNLEKPEDIIANVTPRVPVPELGFGLFLLINEGGEVQLIHMRKTEQIEVESFSPKDLFE